MCLFGTESGFVSNQTVENKGDGSIGTHCRMTAHIGVRTIRSVDQLLLVS